MPVIIVPLFIAFLCILILTSFIKFPYFVFSYLFILLTGLAFHLFIYFFILGLSGKTQLLFSLVFTTRYLDLFLYFVSFYNTLMKLAFIILSYLTCYLMYIKFKTTYNKDDDTFQVLYLLIPSALLALLINHNFTTIEVISFFII